MKISAISSNHYWFISAFILQGSALLLMALDPVEYGFGVMTLWIGALLMMTGILMPLFGWINLSIGNVKKIINEKPPKTVGFALSLVLSFLIYVITLEPTASIWDCAETIAAAYKLQVPHTPGTPLTLLLGRLFSMFSLGDVSTIAWHINLMSAFFSALTVGFVFLMIWHFGKRISEEKGILFFGSLTGALVLAVSDSFWFSAVEAETYGPSVFFMVFIMWLSINGSDLKENDRKRRVYLLSYLIGLSYCIHPMCILIIPVCFLLWNSGKTFKWERVLLSLILGFLIILLISKVYAVDLFEWAFKVDLWMVNGVGFPFYSGVIVLFTLGAGIIYLIWKRYKSHRWVVVSLLLILAGFSPYLMLFVRSAKQPPINEFSPGNLAKIKPYMNRESYPSRPLLYGPYFTAKIEDVDTKAYSYIIKDQQYERVGEIPEYVYERSNSTILPRMYSNDPSHIQVYRNWTGLREGERPRFMDNLQFMWKYQLGHMYGRYLMWNFAGRASDIQHSAWLKPWNPVMDRSGISYNRANNQYFMIPFLLGLIGFLTQMRKDKMGFAAQLSFFLITGILLVLYLNGTPNEPRERDYIYVGSYVAFSIWIGLGIISLSSLFRKGGYSFFGVLMLIVPAWMFYQNLDDHDRSDRTFQIDHARNVLNSCREGGILFTGGDNDTFPLWYLQEVEGFRTDVRVKVLSYFNADWYINELSRQYYESPPFDLTLKTSENKYGPYDPIYIRETLAGPISWNRYMEAINSENPNLTFDAGKDNRYYFLPSRTLIIKTPNTDLNIKVTGSYLPKSDMAILDLISSNDWSRPLYFNFTSRNSLSINLDPYLEDQGMVSQLVPIKPESPNLLRSTENLVYNADYSNLENPDVYFNFEDYQARMIVPIKYALNQLINQYLEQGNKEKVENLISFALSDVYYEHLDPSFADIQLATILKTQNHKAKAKELLTSTFDFFYGRVTYEIQLGRIPGQNDLLLLQEASRLLGDNRYLEKFESIVQGLE